MTRVESVVTDGVTDQDIERQWQKLQRIKPDAFVENKNNPNILAWIISLTKTSSFEDITSFCKPFHGTEFPNFKM